MELSAYERRELARLQSKPLSKPAFETTAQLIPENVRNHSRDLVAKAKELIPSKIVPGKDSRIVRGFVQAVEGLNGFVAKVAHSSTGSLADVTKSYQNASYLITSLDQIEALDLSVVNKVKPNLSLRYVSMAGASGAAAGLAITGGEIAGVGSGGAAAAPGFGVITGALAADAAFILTLCHAAVGHTARYYGFDPEHPGEELLAIQVINAGSALTASSKYAALADLSKLTQQLARRAAWKQLNNQTLTKVLQKFAQFMGVRLTKAGAAKVVPIVGITIGLGANAYLLHQVTQTADDYYRERFLLRKLGSDAGTYVPAASQWINRDDSDIIDIIEIIEDESSKPQSDTDPDNPETESS